MSASAPIIKETTRISITYMSDLMKKRDGGSETCSGKQERAMLAEAFMVSPVLKLPITFF